MNGTFCISLDFEKYWGIHDVHPIDKSQHFHKVEQVVSDLLVLFKKYEIHTTWATVGLLALDSVSALKAKHNSGGIPYANKNYSPFPLTPEKYADFDVNLLLGKKEIEKIKNTPFQEFASHTYSHFYCSETGVTGKDFEADCNEMARIGKENSTSFKSIVFPRNQVNREHLAICKSFGFKSYRGNQENRFWKNSTYKSESLFKKMGRVIDAYFPISKTPAHRVNELPTNQGLLNIPGNRFLRPFTSFNWLERRKVNRIKREMEKAAKKKTVYHLWWHPHNFTKKTEQCFLQLEEILIHYQSLRVKYKFNSLTMTEIFEHAKK